MLTRLYATNYRCLVNFEFKPTAKQLIIGRNGTGKTTVFDVLAMLRDLAALGKPCEDYLGGKTRTCWQDVFEQRFELDVKGNGGEYRYTLVADKLGRRAELGITMYSGGIDFSGLPFVKEETLDFNGKPLFHFREGDIALFGDQQKPEPSVKFPFNQGRSGLAEATWQGQYKTHLVQAMAPRIDSGTDQSLGNVRAFRARIPRAREGSEQLC